MKITLIRLNKDTDSTIGAMYVDGKFQCFTLEDEERDHKIKGETCIDAGVYEVKYRDVVSPLTKKYRDRFDWFKFHVELQNVKDFKYVYIHIGNDDDDSDGCILVASKVSVNTYRQGRLFDSTEAFERVYKKISKALDRKEKVVIEIKDIQL